MASWVEPALNKEYGFADGEPAGLFTASQERSLEKNGFLSPVQRNKMIKLSLGSQIFCSSDDLAIVTAMCISLLLLSDKFLPT